MLRLFSVISIICSPVIAASILPTVTQQKPEVLKVMPEKQGIAQKSITPPQYGMGRKQAPKHVLEARVEWSRKHHGERLTRMAQFTTIPDTYDAVALGLSTDIGDQGNCGDCYWWSAAQTCAGAQLVAGNVSLKADPNFQYSVQQGLDCHPEQGGCDGGFEWDCMQLMMKEGWSSVADYPGAGQRPGTCKPSPPRKYKIANMGYCDPTVGAGGVAGTKYIQAAVLQYGPVSVAGAASYWGDPGSKVITFQDSGVNHAIMITGWKTVGGKVIWRVRNQWGKQWGDGGSCWIQEGACSIGTEAAWVQAPGVTPPVPPTPPEPPIPPVPPTPGRVTITLTPEQVKAVLDQAGVVPTISGGMTLNQLITLVKKGDAKTINYWKLLLDVEKIVQDYNANVPVQVLQADVMQLLADLGLPSGLLKKVAMQK